MITKRYDDVGEKPKSKLDDNYSSSRILARTKSAFMRKQRHERTILLSNKSLPQVLQLY